MVSSLPQPAPPEPNVTTVLDVDAEIQAGRATIESLPHVQAFSLIGSATYMPEGKVGDVDFAVLLEDDRNAIEYMSSMRADAWMLCGEYDDKLCEWGAVRRGAINLIVTHSRTFYDGYLLATEVCKVLDLRDREQRVAVCQVVRDKKKAEEVRPSFCYRTSP